MRKRKPPADAFIFYHLGVMNIREYKYMTHEQRKALATMHAYHVPLAEISTTLGVHLSTLYRELKRGGAEKPGDTYDPDVAEKALKDNFKKRGRVCA